MEKIVKNQETLHAEMPCSYFKDGRISSLEYVFINEDNTNDFNKFLSRGYRRLGNIFYRNRCKECHACKPIRIKPELFEISRSQKRTLKKNRDIRLEIPLKSHVTLQKLELLEKYQNSKHAEEGVKQSSDHETLLFMMHYGYERTIEMNYYLDDRLIGVGIVDEADDSLSSNYFYYDTDLLDRRLGVFSILKEISHARLMKKKYYYLGFYIEDNTKMSYKKFFRPNQILEKGRWRNFL